MAAKNRIFIAFAIEDVRSRDFLVGQARLEHSPFEFVDMSAKKPWDEEWKRHCRARIKGCDGVIALISRNTAKAAGQLWEINTAKEEGVPILGIYTSPTDRPASTPAGIRVVGWSWANIKAFLDRL